MFPRFPVLEGPKDVIEKSVHSTGVPLSERFKHVPSHNPLRPTQVVRRILPDFAAAPTFAGGIPTTPIHGEPFSGIGNQVNQPQLALVKAKKDAEILRLQAQVEEMERQLGKAGDGHGRNNPLKRIMGKVPMKTRAGNLMVEKRAGGGVVFSREGGKHLNLQSASALSALGIDKVRRNPRSPIRGSGRARSGKVGKFYGSPKSKTDLDKELDSYMSKAKPKSKNQTDLDKELDEYMSQARPKSFTGKTGFIVFTPTTPPPDTGEADSDGMEIVEEEVKA